MDKLHDVTGLYLDPPERAVVLCVDEKSQVQTLDWSAPVLPMMPVWTKTAEQIREPIGAYCQRPLKLTNDSGH